MHHRIFLTAAFAATHIAAAQEPSVPSNTADMHLRACAAHADRKVADSALVLGTQAERLFRNRIAVNAGDVDGLVGLARTLSQCLVPSANFVAQGELSAEAMELLERAIELQPNHWLAHFVIGSIAFRSPAFLGRGKRAVQAFEQLLKLQGDRTDNPMYARVFELRGLQLSRSGQVDSARALWVRGARLFPNDSTLQALVGRQVRSQVGPQQAPDSDSAARLGAVRVVASAVPTPPAFPSVREVPRSQVLMTAGGTADVLHALQTLPGTTRVGEGSDIYTRGGNAEETALLLNGGRLLSLSRFEGLNGSMFGALEPFVVRSVRYSSGGFSVRYGNALSGVVDIETDGRPRERQTRAGLSLVQASATTRLPFNKKVGGWVSGRVSRTGALLATHGRRAEFVGAPHSEEVVASVVATPSSGSELRATAILESDDSRRITTAGGWHGPFHSSGGTRAGVLSSRWVSPNAPIVVRTSVAGSERSSDWSFGVLSRARDENSLISRADVDWQSAVNVTVRAGMEHGLFRRNERGTVPTTPNVGAGSPARTLPRAIVHAYQLGAYAETELTRGDATLMLGLRADRLPGEEATSIDPRAALSLRRGEWTARLSAGVFHQGRWRPDPAIPNGGLPAGVPTEARHVVAALERTGIASTFRVETYNKRYDNYHRVGSGPDVRAVVRTVSMCWRSVMMSAG